VVQAILETDISWIDWERFMTLMEHLWEIGVLWRMNVYFAGSCLSAFA
jgi:hypothetical protein